MPVETLDLADVKPLDLSEVKPVSASTLDLDEVKPLDLADVKSPKSEFVGPVRPKPQKRDEGMGPSRVPQHFPTPQEVGSATLQGLKEGIQQPLLPVGQALKKYTPFEIGAGMKAGLPPGMLPNVSPDVLGGAVQGAADFAEGMTTPVNAAIMVGTGGLGAIAESVPLVAKFLSPALGAGFGVQMLHDAYTQIPEVKKAIDEKDYGTAAQHITAAVLAAGMGALGVKHAATFGKEQLAAGLERSRATAEDLVAQEAERPTVVEETPVVGLSQPLNIRKSVVVKGYDKQGKARGPITVEVTTDSGKVVFTGDEAGADAFLAQQKVAQPLVGETTPEGTHASGEPPPAAPAPETYDTPQGKVKVVRRYTTAKGADMVVFETEAQGGTRRSSLPADKFAARVAPKPAEVLDVEEVKPIEEAPVEEPSAPQPVQVDSGVSAVPVVPESVGDGVPGSRTEPVLPGVQPADGDKAVAEVKEKEEPVAVASDIGREKSTPSTGISTEQNTANTANREEAPLASDIGSILSPVTRTGRIGGEKFTAPDPVAAGILKSVKKDPKIEKQINDLIRSEGTAPTFLGAGFDHAVIDLGNNKVMRVGTGKFNHPDNDLFLKPIKTAEYGNIGVEILPKLDTSGITDDDVKSVTGDLKKSGWEWDPGKDNLGRDSKGNLKILDSGGARRIQSVQKNVDRLESMKPEVAETLDLGSTRVSERADGTKFKEKLAEIPVEKIWMNPENKMYRDKIEEYRDNPDHGAIELREMDEPGDYIIHDGHHRFAGAMERGDKVVRAWVPVKDVEANDAELAALTVPELRKEEKSIQKEVETHEDVERLDAVRQEIAERGVEQLSESEGSSQPLPTAPKFSEGDTVKWTAGGKEFTGEVQEVGKKAEHDILKVTPEGTKNPVTINQKKAEVVQAAEPTVTKPADAFKMKGPQLAELAKKGDTGAQAEIDRRAAKRGKETKSAQVETKQPEAETKALESETKPAKAETPKPETETKGVESSQEVKADGEVQTAKTATGGRDRALEGVPSQEVRESEEQGAPGQRGPAGDRADAGDVRATDREGDGTEPSEGSDTGTVGVSTRGGRSAKRPPATAGTDYRITDADNLGQGTAKQKAAGNIEAIRTLKKVEADGRQATPEEQKILAKYVGWGQIPQPFMQDWRVPPEWRGVNEDLKGLLTPEELASAAASTPNAHYTSATVVSGMWDAMKHLGLLPEGGQISLIETSMGTGNFFGLMPEGTDSQRVGVELDSITGRIAKLLYPNADIHVTGFEKVRLPNDYFDLAIGNVPFGNYSIFDPAYKRTPFLTRAIHNYFFAKGLDKVRPGGVVAFITSSYTMDAKDPQVREYLAERADLLGAIRLPNTAFKENAGTEVTTDIIFLQKRAPGQEKANYNSWTGLKEFKSDDGPMEINEYFARNPDMMLGKMGLRGTMHSAGEPALIGKVTKENLAEAIEKLPANVVTAWQAPQQSFDSVSSIPEKGELKDGAYTVKDGQIVVRHGDQLRPVDMSKDQMKLVKGQIAIREAMQDVFRTQREEAPAAEIEKAMNDLVDVYDKFIKENGPLHKAQNAKAFAEDPDAPVLLALEDWDPEEKKAKKTDIFTKRVIDTTKPATSADNAKDALSLSLNEKGRIDWTHMQELTGKTPAEMQEELGELIFQNPAGRRWEPADEYLSGNVRRKLEEAEIAARSDKGFEKNVEALKAVQPKELVPGEIKARLGAAWIPASDVRDFASKLLDTRVDVGHSEALATWSVIPKQKDTVANNRTWGTERYYGHELMEDALNMRTPTVYDTIGSGADAKRVINEPQTLAAREMQAQIKTRFQEWAWEDPARAERLAAAYNVAHNSERLWQPDGSHLTFPGMAITLKLRPHQKNGVWRVVRGDGNVLFAHVVGSGKTLTMIASAMELRRLGRSRKPLVVVPKNRVKGTATEWFRAYPSANILVIGGDDFTPEKRQQMMARIATGNWDGVIVSYEAFIRLPISDDTFNDYLQTQIDQLEDYIRDAKGDKADARIVKELEKSKKRLEAKIRTKADDLKRDTGIKFEDLGVDSLFVDEADCLPYETPVLTDIGVMPIGAIVEGKLKVKVASFNKETNSLEWSRVSGWHWNPRTEPLVRVTHEHGQFDCTRRHKVWTDAGYVEAQALGSEHMLRVLPEFVYANKQGSERQRAEVLLSPMRQVSISTADHGNQNLSAMRDLVHVPIQRGNEQRKAAILQQSLCGNVEEPSGREARSIQGMDISPLGMHKGVEAAGRSGASARPESQIKNSGVDRKASTILDREDFFGARRQWGLNQTADVACRETIVSDGICHRDGYSEDVVCQPPELLQSGSGTPGLKDRYRGGREQSQNQKVEVFRPTKNLRTEGSRVVSVEVLEQRCDVIAGLRGDIHNRAYCLEVEGNHNFVANGVVVSNSFKNLQFPTKMSRISGIPNTESERAFDMYIKTQYIAKRNNGRGIIFATGTPVSNSMAEVWTMQRYLQPKYLQEHGLEHFDAWAQTFGEVNPAIEMTPDGSGIRVVMKFNKFVNAPELIKGFRQMADVQTARMLKLPVPKLKGGKTTIVSAKASPEQQEHLKTLAQRAKTVKGKKPMKGADNILVIGTDGQKAALDMRMVDPNARDNPNSKLNMAIENVYQTWKETKDQKLTQLVFSDLGVPNKKNPTKFNVYNEIKNKLVRRGVPAAEIAFIQDYKDDDEKENLFAAVNKGRVRILIGSTGAMGVGVNVQKKLKKEHHLDAPHRPRDVEQREGRMIRQGNENEEVENIRYVTEPSFDARKWDILQNKASYINAFMEGDITVREIEDISDAELSYGEIAAIASGNPAIREKVVVDTEIRKLDAMKSRIEAQQFGVRRDMQRLPEMIEGNKRSLAKVKQDIATRDANPAEFVIQGKRFSGEGARAGAAEAIHMVQEKNRGDVNLTSGFPGSKVLKIGSYRGLDLEGFYYPGQLSGKEPPLPSIHVVGKDTYGVNTHETEPLSTVQSIEAVVRNLESRADNYEEYIEKDTKKLADTEKIAGAKFEKQEELNKLIARQKELEKLLQTAGSASGADTIGGSEEEESEPEESSLAVKRKKGEVGTAPIITDLVQWMQDQFGDDSGKVNYSGLGALQTKFTRNLSQLKKASSESHEAAVRAASSRAQSATILRAAIPEILGSLKDGPFTWPEMRLAMIESRLRGLQERWLDLAAQVPEMDDEETEESYGNLSGLLESIEGKKGFPQNLSQTAAAIVSAKDWNTLREFLEETFLDAAANVAEVMDPAWFDAVARDPQIQKALGIYKRLVEKPMAENHALNEGVFSTALGPLDTYYPLIPMDRKRAQGPGRRLPYRKPKNIANAFATGLSESYDSGMEAFRDRLGAAVRANDKAALIDTLEEQGLIKRLPRNQQAPDTFRYRGEEYQAERVELTPGKILVQGGKTVQVPGAMGLMPRWLARELRPILERQQLSNPTVIDKITRILNTISLAGPADFVFHTANLLGTLVANTPFLENSLSGKVLSAPLVKKFYAVAKIATTNPTNEEAARDLVEMAKIGVVPDRYGSETYSKRLAEEYGAEHKPPFVMGPLLYGPHGIDIRARLIMYRVAKEINPDASAAELRDFVNQLGNYVPALQGEIERTLKGSGISPFYTAGSTMLRNGVNAWTGAGPMPKGGTKFRLWQQLTGGGIVMLGLWALTYHQMTGKWPWEDKQAKLLQIPAPDKFRRSTLGRQLWGDGPEVGYLNFGYFNPLVARGSRTTGMSGAFEAKVLGGSLGQMMEAGQRDVLNSLLHPVLGPVPRALFVLGTGEEPYITGLRDRQGMVGVQFFPAIPPKTKPGMPAIGRRAMAAAAELNSFYGDAGSALGQSTGFLGEDKTEKGNKWVRMIIDTSGIGTGAISNSTNPYSRANALSRQRSGTR